MKKILVIQTDTDLPEIISELLTLKSFQVVGTKNLNMVLKLAKEQRFDLILCDTYPGFHSHEVLQKLRQDQAIAHIPFIFLTTEVSVKNQLLAAQLGVSDYMKKPMVFNALIPAIAQQLPT